MCARARDVICHEIHGDLTFVGSKYRWVHSDPPSIPIRTTLSGVQRDASFISAARACKATMSASFQNVAMFPRYSCPQGTRETCLASGSHKRDTCGWQTQRISTSALVPHKHAVRTSLHLHPLAPAQFHRPPCNRVTRPMPISPPSPLPLLLRC